MVRSAMAPETMVAAVPANTAWNIQKARIHWSPLGLQLLRKKSEVPKNPFLVAPNIIPKPSAQNINEPMEKSIMFFIMMFMAFFALVKPASTIANPACMKNTKAAASSVQR